MAAALTLFSQALPPQNALDDFVGRFEHDANPIHRAKLMPKLGDAEFQAIQKDVADGDLPAAIALLQQAGLL